LRVALAPEDVALAVALASSDLIALVGEAEAELTLARRADGGWALTDDVHGTGETDNEPALSVIPAARLDVARAAVEHYHAYVTPLRMAHACSDLPGLLRLWLLDCGDATISPAVAQDPDLPQVEAGTLAPYELTVGRRICFVVDNAAEVPLTVALIDCAASGRVLLLGEKRLPKSSKHVFWFQDTLGQPFAPALPEGLSVGIDRIVAIATTRTDVSLRYLERRQSFADVMAPVRSRGIDSRSATTVRAAGARRIVTSRVSPDGSTQSPTSMPANAGRSACATWPTVTPSEPARPRSICTSSSGFCPLVERSTSTAPGTCRTSAATCCARRVSSPACCPLI